MYIDPNTVVSPKTSWKLKRVIYNSGAGGWSAAEGEWEGTPRLGMRWNGSDTEDGVGNPQSRGHATWFIIPEGLESAMLREIDFLTQTEDVVSCSIKRPNNYDYGAWRIEAKLSSQSLKKLKGCPLIFKLPTLQNRMYYPDKGYASAIEGELRGVFVDDKWSGDVYSNGISEDENPSKIEAVQEAFIQSVMQAIRAD